MFLRRFLIRQDIYRKCVTNNAYIIGNVKYRSYTGIIYNIATHNIITCIPCKENQNIFLCPSHQWIFQRHNSTKEGLDGDSLLAETQYDNELKKITELFPEARVTLNIFADKTPDKIFQIHYRQQVVAPKGQNKSEEKSNNEWTCTYAFVWPEKIEFESTAISKRQAAEKAATQALHYLYINRRIDNSGKPTFDRDVLDEVKSTLNQPLHASLSENSLERIEKVSSDHENEIKLKKITELFPEPRVTLNIFATRTPDKVFDIHYRQQVVAPKGRKKSKEKSNNEWTCTYSFVWPVKIKFESSAISKSQAAEKAATQALNYLYINRRIDKSGKPIFDREVLGELKTTLNQPLHASLSEKSLERIETVWSDYENGIKEIYEKTFQEAKEKMNRIQPVLSKDSTIDDEDGFPDVENELDSEITDLSEDKVRIHPVYGKPLRPPSEASLQRRERALKARMEAYRESLQPLPIDQYAEEITSTVDQSQVTIVVGAAGCGKSTRVPAAILEKFGANCEAIVSEPRRVAAIGLAERVASELGEDVGESVGYTVRLQAQPPRPPGGAILYCTSGILLRRLQTNPGLEGCSHVIIDEAHERDVYTDLTLLLLKRALINNPKLKILVMSATLDVGVFTRHFGSCPVIEVPGRTFPVEVSYLEDIQSKFNVRLPLSRENCTREDGKPRVHCQEIAEVIKAVDKTQPEGAILVFLPGWAEIKRTKTLLDEHFLDSSMHMILPVHSRLSTAEQTKMFAKPSLGVRKIVLATNVAETSITIPDAVYVIDSGAHKENRIVEGSGTASLVTVWVSLAGAKQRAGRAGRVQPGHCYRMYTKEKEADFVPHTTPEILRIPLDQTVLECKAFAPDDKIEDFLSELPEPPTKKAIQFAINDLIDLGALTPSERLTPTGTLLTRLPLPPRAARSILHSIACSNVLSMSHVAAHVTAAPDLFENAPERREELREIKRNYNPTSDHAALHCIQEEFSETLSNEGWSGVNIWCEKKGIIKDRLWFVKSLSNLYITSLLKTGIVEPTIEVDELNRFSDIDELTVGVLLSGSNALLKTRRQIRTKGKLKTSVDLITSAGERAQIGSDSVNHGITKQMPPTASCLFAYYTGRHSVERRALVVHNTSILPPHTALLFCMGDVRKLNSSDAETTILRLPKHKLQIHVPTSQVDSLLRTREMLWSTLQYYLERNVKTLDYDENTLVSRFRTRLMKTVCRILVEAQKEIVQGELVEKETNKI